MAAESCMRSDTRHRQARLQDFEELKVVRSSDTVQLDVKPLEYSLFFHQGNRVLMHF